MNDWYVYIIDKEGKLYVGVTTDLENRMRQHGVESPLYFEGPMAKAEALTKPPQHFPIHHLSSVFDFVGTHEQPAPQILGVGPAPEADIRTGVRNSLNLARTGFQHVILVE
jgi:hypothetical protein